MKTYFSKRHRDAIKNKLFPLSFTRATRCSICRILNQYSGWGGWDNSENFTFESATEALKTFYGKTELEAFDDTGSRTPTNFSGLIEKGYPGEVIDAIEAWFDQKTKYEKECEKELNELLAMNLSPWRFINGEAILVNSDYLHSEVRAKTLRLLREGTTFGALEEFQGAIHDLQSGETKDAVVKAHKSVESVMKTALGTDEHLTFGKLLRNLIESGIIPKYYEEFLIHFDKLALGAVKERNRPGTGHGQGSTPTEVPKTLAEFAVNLAGSLNLFIIQHWIELKSEKSEIESAIEIDEDIPF